MREIDYLSLGAVLGGSFYIGNNNEKHSIYELVASMFGEEYEKIFNLTYSPVTYKRPEGDNSTVPNGIILLGAKEQLESGLEKIVRFEIGWHANGMIVEQEGVTQNEINVEDGLGKGIKIEKTKIVTEIEFPPTNSGAAEYLGKLAQVFFDTYAHWVNDGDSWSPRNS